MLLRRMFGGTLLAALLVPLLYGGLPGSTRTVAGAGAAGANCCVAMPCCEIGGTCVTGACGKPDPPPRA